MAFLDSSTLAAQAISRLNSIGSGRGEPGNSGPPGLAAEAFLPNIVAGPPKKGGGLPSLTSGAFSGGALPLGNLGSGKVITNVTESSTTPLLSYRDFFHQNLEKWATSIPLRTQWLIFIDAIPKGVSTEFLQVLEPMNGDKRGFEINQARQSLNTHSVQEIAGCILAQGVNMPDDSFEIDNANIPNNRGFIPGKVGGVRSAFQDLTIEFRETNTSFTDMVIRPWVILAAHAGLVARDRDNDHYMNPKCNITIINLGKTLPNVAPIHRKIFRYYNCVPKSVSTRNLTYDSESLEFYQTGWSFSHYDVLDNKFVPGISASVEAISKSRNLPSHDDTSPKTTIINRSGVTKPVMEKSKYKEVKLDYNSPALIDDLANTPRYSAVALNQTIGSNPGYNSMDDIVTSTKPNLQKVVDKQTESLKNELVPTLDDLIGGDI